MSINWMNNSRLIAVILVFMVAVCMGGAVFAQEASEPPVKEPGGEEVGPTPAPSDEGKEVSESVAEPSKAKQSIVEAEETPVAAHVREERTPTPRHNDHPTAPGRVTFDFKEADLRNILRIFSVRYGINVVAGPDVQGTVTIRLVDVPWETALKLILQSNNYAYVKEANVYRVLRQDQLDKEPLQTQVYPLSYSKATEVINSIINLLTPERGQARADERSNTLVVTDVPAKLDEIGGIIRRLDERTPQVLIEARIVELTDDFEENIGIDWISLKGFNVGFGAPEDADKQGLWRYERTRDKGDTDTTERITTDRDRTTTTRGRQRTDQSGPDGSSTTTTISTIPGTSSGTTITTTSGTSLTDTSTLSNTREVYDWYDAEGTKIKSDVVESGQLLQAVLTPDTFQLTLSFLQEQTDANIISHPKLVTADNKESQIKVAREWPIPQFQFNDDTGQWEVSDFEYKDIGIILTVTPHVNVDKFITMRVVPEVSNIFGTTTFGGAVEAELPIILSRKAQTEVLVKNGDTLAIGGLMMEDETDAVNKVPLLGDIPLLGRYIFSDTGTQINKSNIIIFITANVVTVENKDNLWISQREKQTQRINLPQSKWWEPKKLRYGLGSKAGY
jgi:type II secretory pathway component GspD/PulD (secretin)